MKRRWSRLVSDFADRRVEAAQKALGEITDQEKRTIRSYFTSMGTERATLTDLEWHSKYSKENRVQAPEIVRRYFAT